MYVIWKRDKILLFAVIILLLASSGTSLHLFSRKQRSLSMLPSGRYHSPRTRRSSIRRYPDFCPYFTGLDPVLLFSNSLHQPIVHRQDTLFRTYETVHGYSFVLTFFQRSLHTRFGASNVGLVDIARGSSLLCYLSSSSLARCIRYHLSLLLHCMQAAPGLNISCWTLSCN